MGLVQSQDKRPEHVVEVDGFAFTIEEDLKRFIPLYGNLVVDVKKAFLGDNFTVRFSQSAGGCC